MRKPDNTGDKNMNKKRLAKLAVPLVILLAPLSVRADALFGNDMAGDAKLPRTWGIGIDYFEMDQPYMLDSLSIVDTVDAGGVPIPIDLQALLVPDPDVLPIGNDIRHNDIKIDVWVLPFLNVFGIYGRIDGDTVIDIGALGLPLPPQTNSLTVDYDGDVFGGGIVLAVGGERWFASLTGTFTDTDLGGDFKSSVEATTVQPRVGLRFGDHTEFWIGGYFLDAEEKHSGVIDLDLGVLATQPIPIGGGQTVNLDGQDVAFDVNLSQDKDFNISFGTHMMFNDAWEATVEVGAGDRATVLANITYRFE